MRNKALVYKSRLQKILQEINIFWNLLIAKYN